MVVKTLLISLQLLTDVMHPRKTVNLKENFCLIYNFHVFKLFTSVMTTILFITSRCFVEIMSV